MIQRRDRAGFALETFVKLGLGNFDGDDAIEACVIGLVHVTHSASTQGHKDSVGAEFFAHGKRHTCDLAQFSRSART